MLSFGRLGILGRNGWFCREADVEQFTSIAGWRGLRDPDVRRLFNGTFHAVFEDWGPNRELIAQLRLPFDIVYHGTGWVDVLRHRLDADVPSLFYLWSPHPFNARYGLSRIELPTYTPSLFKAGRSDYPTDVLEKVGSKELAVFAPAVAKLYTNFFLDTSAQESMLAAIDAGELSAMQAACGWMRQQENEEVWRAWFPVEKLTCDPGKYAAGASSCTACPPGSGSVGGAATACVQCSAGMTALPAAGSHAAPAHGRVQQRIHLGGITA